MAKGKRRLKSGKRSRDRIQERERRVKEARKFNLLSNVFMSVALQDKDACQHVLRILLDMPNLTVKEIRSQYRISKVTSHDAILDVLAEDENGRLFNIEIQRGDTIDHARRVRFYGSMVDSEYLEKGCGYDELPDVFIVYISETDIWKTGTTFCEVEKSLKFQSTSDEAPTRRTYGDGQKILFVNAEIDDGSAKAELMKYFKTANPHDRSQGALSDRVHYLKCEEGGHSEMCEIADKIYNEGVENGRKRGLAAGRKRGLADGKRIGRKRGLTDGKKIGRKRGLTEGIAASIAICRQYRIPDGEIIRNLMEKFSLSEQEAKKHLAKFS